MQLSIIIPAFNEEGIIGETLEQIDFALSKNEHLGVSWEVIVCDNNSSDHTAAIAKAAGAKVVFEPVNQISRGRNTGAETATGDWFLFIDADSYPPPGLIAETIELIQEGESIGCSSTIKVTDGPLWYRKRLVLFQLDNCGSGELSSFRARRGSHGKGQCPFQEPQRSHGR